jgi:hypothetical protein
MMQKGYSREHWALLPFLIGVIVGVSVSTVILVRPYTEQIVTNVYIMGGDNGLEHPNLELEERLSRYEKLMAELHPTENKGTGPKLLADELKMLAPVHYSVILSDSDMVEILRNTWTKDIPQSNINYYFPPASELPTGIPNGVQLSTDGLLEIQVLKHVCTEKVNSTKWYFIGYDTSYVKTLELEAYLLTLEAIQDQLPYMGKPVKREPLGRLCLPGPGSVLSSSILSQMCDRVSNCVTAEEKLETDCALGECVSKQLPGVQCNKDFNRPQSLFVRFDSNRKGPIVDSKNKNTLHRALTIYPVVDSKLMYNIHQLVVGSRLNASQHFAQELKQTEDQMKSLLPSSGNEHVLSAIDTVKTREDITPWQLINHNRLMERESDNPARKVPGFWKAELDSLTSVIMGYLVSLPENSQQLVFSRVVNAYWRLHPLTGMQYVIDFEAKSEVTKGEQAAAPLLRFSVHLFRAYSPPELSPIQPQVHSSKKVVIAIVMTAEQESQLQSFMKRLEHVLNEDQRLDLIVVKMRTEKERQTMTKKSDESLETVLKLYEKRYSTATFKLVSSPYILSRAHGLALALHEVKPTDILFLSDLHLSFNASLMDRCRSIPLQSQQVYYPIPFATSETIPNSSSSLMPQSGHWLVKSHSTVCIYAADVISSMQQTGAKGIPDEVDMEQLYQGLLEREYEVVRSVDSGLLKRGTPENSDCELDLVGEVQEPCKTVHKSSFMKLQLSSHLSQILFDHEGKHSEKKF